MQDRMAEIRAEVEADVASKQEAFAEASQEFKDAEVKLSTAKKELDEAQEVLTKLREVFGKESPKGKAKGKAKASKTKPAAAPTAATKGKKPPLKSAIINVMGDQTMTAGDLIEALKKKDWLPESNNIRNYISYVLSQNKDLFGSKERGKYFLKAGAAARGSNGHHGKKNSDSDSDTGARKEDSKKGEEVGKPEGTAASEKSADDVLAEIGLEKGKEPPPSE